MTKIIGISRIINCTINYISYLLENNVWEIIKFVYRNK